MQTHRVLHEPGDTFKSVYFCNSGLLSILSVFLDGKSVEVALVGKEGFIGLPLVAGSAFRIDGEALMKILPQCPGLQRGLQRFAQMVTMQTRQLSACNRLHEVNEGLARWLLMSDDRIGTKGVRLNQELLAQTLGTRRSSVTVAHCQKRTPFSWPGSTILDVTTMCQHCSKDFVVVDNEPRK